MGFPSEFPSLAIQQLGKAIMGTDTDKGRAALAFYELLGFGLGKAFGDVKYLMADDPQAMADAIAASPPEVKQAIDWLQANEAAAIPPVMVPLLMKAVEWFAKYLFERLKS